MIYSPVIIPTLNRHTHFKRCLESLERCYGADKTVVYVGLDYPPSEKYTDGWLKNDEYLKKKETKNGFEKLIVVRRDRNRGVCGKGSNFSLLYQTVIQTSDTVIVSEDDNEFAPSFLEFINNALERYKDNPKVVSVCGYSQPSYNKPSVKANQIFVQDNSAWGTGMWKEKEAMLEKYDQRWCYDVMGSFSKVHLLMRRFPMLVSMMINMLKKGVAYGDTRKTCANILNGTFQVRPKVSLVRNWGNDGSGVNCKKIIGTSSEKLDMREHFELSDCPVARTVEVDKDVYNILLPKNRCLKFLKIIKIWCKYLIYRLSTKQ